MAKTLWEKFNSSYDHISTLQWRVFRGKEKICSDYGASHDNSLDDAEVIKAEVKERKNGTRYVRVTVK